MPSMTDHHGPNWIVPVGSAAVAAVPINGRDGTPLKPAGSVGVISRSPVDHLHAYRVRFPDGVECSLARDQFDPLRTVQRAAIDDRDAGQADDDLLRHVILRCIIGSRAYGLDGDESDTDRRGVFLPPASMDWSIWGVPEQIERDETQECHWELQKFLTLALKANPNILECLYSPLIEFATPLGEELLAMRAAFLSKLVFQTYNGYVISQFQKMQRDMQGKGAVKWKHAMHLIRLLQSGITVLREGFVPVRVEDGQRDALLAIRRGERTFDDIDRWRSGLNAEFEQAFERTELPDRPDYQRVNAFLVKARRSMAEAEA